MRERIQYHLMCIDIDDEDTKDLMEKVYEKSETWKGKERLVLPAFDLYGTLIGHDNGNKWIITSTYESTTTSKRALIL